MFRTFDKLTCVPLKILTFVDLKFINVLFYLSVVIFILLLMVDQISGADFD